MKKLNRNSLAAAGILAAGVFCWCVECSAQTMPSLFNAKSLSKRSDVPTLISAASMDLDIANNMATLIGNVEIDDQDMKINCDKMILYMEDKKDDEEAKNDSGEKNTNNVPVTVKTGQQGDKKTDRDGKKEAEPEDPTGGKTLRRIECHGEVVIIRKQPKTADGKPQPEQKALADKAVYDVEKDTIELTGKPVLLSGKDRLDARKLVFHMSDGRITALDPKTQYYGDSNVNIETSSSEKEAGVSKAK